MGFAANGFGSGYDSNCVSEWGASNCAAMAAVQAPANETLFQALLGAGYDLHVFNRLDIGGGLLDRYSNITCEGDGFHGGPSLPILARSADIRKPTDVNPIQWVNDTTPVPYRPDIVSERNVTAWLQSHDPNGPQPWMLWFGILDPHPPYDTNATYLAQVNVTAVDVPAQPDRASMHPGDSYMSISKNVWGNYTDEQVQAVRRSYWGAVAQADAIMGRVLAMAASTGHLNNTVVIFTSDHGEMAMEHRQDLKNSLYEPSVRVPLVMAAYGQAKATTGMPSGLVVTNITSHVDLVPTVLELAGVPGALPAARGYSLSPFFSSSGTGISNGAGLGTMTVSAPFPRNYSAFEFHSNLGNTGCFGLRQGRWKYITYGTALYPWFGASYTSQLFDIQADPFEMSDVAGQYPDVVSAMHDTLVAEWRGRTPQNIDLEAKTQDVDLYQAVYGQLNSTAKRAAFEAAYQGFDDVDWARVQAWEQLGARSSGHS